VTETGMDKAKDMANPGQMQLLPDLLVAQPTMPALSVGRWDTLLETVRTIIKDAPEQTSSTSMMNLTPMKNSNLLTRSPKSETNLT